MGRDGPSAGKGSVVRTSPVVLVLGIVVAVLALVAAATGLLASGGSGERTFVTVRGATVHLHGTGLYELDTVFSAAGQRGTDLVTIVLGVPC